MKWFENLKISSKLSFVFGAVLLLWIVTVGISYSIINTLNKTIENLHTVELTSIEYVNKIDNLINAIRASTLTLTLTTNKAQSTNLVADIKKYSQEINNKFNVLEDLQKNNEKFIKNLNALKVIRSESDKTRNNQIIPLALEGKFEEARAIAMESQDDRYETSKNISNELTKIIQNDSSDNLKEATREAIKFKILLVSISIFSLAFFIVLIFILNRLIANPLEEISFIAKKITSGDVSNIQLKELDRQDEVGVLSNSFKQMASWLQFISSIAIGISHCDLTNEIKPQSAKDVLGNAFLTMQKNLKKLTVNMSEVINNLNASASEISSSTTQLASSASETATSVNETTSTIEEVKQTSQIASQKAKTVSETAQKSTEVSELGKQAAEEITSSINLIRNQMELIAESMVKLNEQTQAIGVIIESVDDIAQQSNLLAVNASIEAVKAGEQGKGFSVVAQEVKSLAHQSKQATNQVRSILGDIQKAATSAVIATEQGSKAVEAGVRKSEDTGKSILELVNTVNEASQAAIQISAISHQQLVGMEEAAIAMENIKQASEQNVVSAKQLEVSSGNIKELSSKLKNLVRQYKIKSEGDEYGR